MEVRGTANGITVYDDFAHHPTAIAATIAGLRRQLNGALDRAGDSAGSALIGVSSTVSSAVNGGVNGGVSGGGNGGARVLAVVEPRSNTMKLGMMNAQLPSALAQADRVFGYGQKLGWDLSEVLKPLGDKARAFDDIAILIQAVTEAARPGDHVLVMSNGGFGGVHAKILESLAAATSAYASASAPATASATTTIAIAAAD